MLQMISLLLFGLLCLIQVQQGTNVSSIGTKNLKPSFDLASSLNCFKCTASSEASCLTIQKETTCHSERNGACIIVTYESIKDGSRTTSYMKGCQKSINECNAYCVRPDVVDDVEGCKVSCCTGDLCNKSGFVKKEVIKDNRKRATNEKSAGSRSNNFSLVLIIVGIILCMNATIWSH